MEIRIFLPDNDFNIILLTYLCYDDKELTDACWATVSGLMKRINPANLKYDDYSLDEADDLKNNIGTIRDAVRTLLTEAKKLGLKPSDPIKGLDRKSTFAPFWPVLKEGLNRSSGDMRESTANAIIDLTRVMTKDGIKPSAIAIMGALIRAMGDKWAANVKSATLNSITELLKKLDVALKAFFPQLQTVLTKNLAENELKTRKCAVFAIAELAKYTNKPDQLLAEIFKIMKAQDGPDTLETFTFAVRVVIENCGSKLTEKSIYRVFFFGGFYY